MPSKIIMTASRTSLMEFCSEQAVFCDEIGTEGFSWSESPKFIRFLLLSLFLYRWRPQNFHRYICSTFQHIYLLFLRWWLVIFRRPWIPNSERRDQTYHGLPVTAKLIPVPRSTQDQVLDQLGCSAEAARIDSRSIFRDCPRLCLANYRHWQHQILESRPPITWTARPGQAQRTSVQLSLSNRAHWQFERSRVTLFFLSGSARKTKALYRIGGCLPLAPFFKTRITQRRNVISMVSLVLPNLSTSNQSNNQSNNHK